MTPAEAEFDVTDEGVVKSLLAGFSGPVSSGPVSSGPVSESSHPEVLNLFVGSLGSLRVRRG